MFNYWEEQKRRAKKYPPDRIAFLGTATACNEDTKVFRELIHNRISLEECCALVARNNYLEEVTPNQLINELKITGWLR